ncbi:unnamed protein product [Durusdinium trenchii]|uniref:Uncharacterized protein n=1 Tax=Durusdinium trenchii TaxID=1381693 RepID=A0ABP0JTM0_9DINO
MLTALFEKLNEWKENGGLTITRTRKCGSRGLVTFQDTWTWPTASLPDLFPAVRSDCKGKIMNKDTVSAAIRRARKTFVPPNVGEVKVANIRSHSGRHRAINDLKMHNVKTEVGKRFARISSEAVWKGYGKLTVKQAADELRSNKKLQEHWQEIYTSK